MPCKKKWKSKDSKRKYEAYKHIHIKPRKYYRKRR